MKKISLLLAALVLSISLVACNDVEEKELNPIEKEFAGVLDDIQTVEVGTAGSSLKAVSHTIGLMNWAVGSEISDEQISTIVNDKMNSLSEEEAQNFKDSFDLVYSTYTQILGENGQALLDDSGVDAMSIGFTPDMGELYRVELIDSLLK